MCGKTADPALVEDGRTQLTIEESEFKQNGSGLEASYNNCEGWIGMMCAMKAFLEHGINVRSGFYK